MQIKHYILINLFCNEQIKPLQYQHCVDKKKVDQDLYCNIRCNFPPIINIIFFSVINIFHGSVINMERLFDDRLWNKLSG